MYAGWLHQLRFIKRHLSMLLIAFGWLMIQSQVAIASHDCARQTMRESVTVHAMNPSAMGDGMSHMALVKKPLCDKHCVPDLAQPESHHLPLVALPTVLTLAVAAPVCSSAAAAEGGSLTPPAAGPPVTIRFCRFRE